MRPTAMRVPQHPTKARDAHGTRSLDVSELHQAGLDAAFNLLAMRRQIVKHVDQRGRVDHPAIDLVGVGLHNIRRALCYKTSRSREVRAANVRCTGEKLWELHEADLRSSAHGVHMYDVFDIESLGSGAQEYLATHEWGSFSIGVAPLQMKVYDRSCVIVEGPPIGGERSTMAVSDRRLLAAAWEYWTFVSSSAVEIGDVVSADPVRRFTPRQREIAHMLADDLTDDASAARLEVSTRTVRSEIAALMRLLRARSRFGAGLRLGQLGFEYLGDHDQELQ